MIYDLRFTISSRHARGIEYLCQLLGLILQCPQSLGLQKARSLGKLDPKACLIGLLEHDGNFVDEISARFAAQGRAVVGGDRAPATRDLIGHSPAGYGLGQRIREFQNTNSKLHGSLLEFFGSHRPASLPLGNHQS